MLVGMSGGNSVVESLPSKQMVAGSSPVPRSRKLGDVGHGVFPIGTSFVKVDTKFLARG
jgi:hypothetical protein